MQGQGLKKLLELKELRIKLLILEKNVSDSLGFLLSVGSCHFKLSPCNCLVQCSFILGHFCHSYYIQEGNHSVSWAAIDAPFTSVVL